MGDARTLECLQGAHFGIEYQGTRSCSVSIYTSGRIVFMMDSDMYEIPAGELDVNQLINTTVPDTNGGGLSSAYFEYKNDASTDYAQVVLVGDASGWVLGGITVPNKDLYGVIRFAGFCEFR